MGSRRPPREDQPRRRKERYTGPPMIAGNMRANGVSNLAIECELCRHRALLSIDEYPDDLPLTLFDRRMVCTNCGIIGCADVRPNWKERPERPSITGMQWR